MGNFFSGIRREAWMDPATGEITITLDGLQGHALLNDFQVSTRPVAKESPIPIEDDPFFLYNNFDNQVNILSPPVTLFAFENALVPNGINEASTHGTDERFEVDRFDSIGLEGVIKAMVHRAQKLRKESEHGSTQRHVYPYLVYHPNLSGPIFSDLSTFSGRSLTSYEISPQVKRKMGLAAEYYGEKKGCLYCNLVESELSKKTEKSKIIFKNGDAIAVNLGTKVRVIPRDHIVDFNHLGNSAGLTDAIYFSLMALEGLSGAQRIAPEVINAAFHSAPLHEYRGEPFMGRAVEDFFHTHVEIGAARIPRGLDPYKVPFSGYTVTTVSPERDAKKIGYLPNHETNA